MSQPTAAPTPPPTAPLALDPEACWRALASRDPRFDGRIFFGVVTTGIYCRPVCPARKPRRENVRFFPCAAAAADAGFRPCLRCRPEAAPHTPAWRGTSASVGRALGLIADGALDAGSVGDLADRLGMGERHLRRLFDEHLGASPRTVARTRRVHFAKQLLDETPLPMAEIASAAGFGSVRRFNAAMRDVYGVAPRELRARALGRRSRAHGTADDPHVELRLAWRPPYDWSGVVAYLGARAIPGVERVEGDVYRRSIAVDGEARALEASPLGDGSGLRLKLPPMGGRALADAVERARRIFDLAADPAEVAADLARDPALRPRIRAHPGLRVPGAWSGFELAVRAILGQQVTVAGATSLAGRLVRRFGTPFPEAEGDPASDATALGALFPTPAALAEADVASIGLPRARAEAIRSLAAAVAAGELDLDAVTAPEREAALESFAALPGIGPWTAQYVAMRALREPDAFPEGDLGLRRALADAGGGPVAAAALRERAEAWRPWRAYAAMALWWSPEPVGVRSGRRSRSARARPPR